MDEQVDYDTPEWARYPTRYQWEVGNRVWYLSRAGDRWWYESEGWRSFHRCTPQTVSPVCVVAPTNLTTAVVPAIIEAFFADADTADIAILNAADARASAAALASHAVATATIAQASQLRAAHEVHNLARGMFQSANHRGVQLQIAAAAGDMTQQANVNIGLAQAELVNPTPPQPQVVQEVAWHSTLHPAATTQDTASDDSVGDLGDAVEDAAVEHADDEHAATDHAVQPGASTVPIDPAPVTTVAVAAHQPATTTGILAMLPAITFPWPASNCVAPNGRAARMQARHANH